jgi:hypothetical protein
VERDSWATISYSAHSFARNRAPEPTQPHDDQKENQIVKSKAGTEGQWNCQTQQTSQNTYEKAMNRSGLLGPSTDNNSSKESQNHLKPRHHLGTEPRGKVINGSLVGSTSGLKGQAKRIKGNDDSQNEET